MRFDYDHVTNLEYKVRAQKLRIREFESGERYVKLKKLHGAEIRKKDSEIGRLKPFHGSHGGCPEGKGRPPA